MSYCKSCNKETSNPSFCSRSCAAKYNNSTKPKRKKKGYICSSCGVQHFERRVKCSSCREEDKQRTVGDVVYTKHHKSSAYSLIRTQARAVTKHLLQECANCGYDKHVETCHIKPISSYTLDTPLSIVNSLSNLVLLCPNCHWEFDSGLLALSS